LPFQYSPPSIGIDTGAMLTRYSQKRLLSLTGMNGFTKCVANFY
jgi:hypothetical protein